MAANRIKVQCPHCQAAFEAPAQFKGKKGQCPKCKQSFVVEDGEGFVPLTSMDGAEVAANSSTSTGQGYDIVEPTRRCSACGEEILALAKKCKHCGEWLNAASTEFKHSPPKARVQQEGQQTDVCAVLCFAAALAGTVILPILFVSAAYVFAIVSYFRLKDNPQLKGKGLRLAGALINTVSILWLMYVYRFGFFM